MALCPQATTTLDNQKKLSMIKQVLLYHKAEEIRLKLQQIQAKEKDLDAERAKIKELQERLPL